MVEIWNARSELFFYPTIRAAITAGCPWLTRLPGVLRIGEIDLRPVAVIQTLDFEPDPRLSCGSCRPNPPFAKLIRLKSRSAKFAR